MSFMTRKWESVGAALVQQRCRASLGEGFVFRGTVKSAASMAGRGWASLAEFAWLSRGMNRWPCSCTNSEQSTARGVYDHCLSPECATLVGISDNRWSGNAKALAGAVLRQGLACIWQYDVELRRKHCGAAALPVGLAFRRTITRLTVWAFPPSE
jgi:hypothetical protein